MEYGTNEHSFIFYLNVFIYERTCQVGFTRRLLTSEKYVAIQFTIAYSITTARLCASYFWETFTTLKYDFSNMFTYNYVYIQLFTGVVITRVHLRAEAIFLLLKHCSFVLFEHGHVVRYTVSYIWSTLGIRCISL